MKMFLTNHNLFAYFEGLISASGSSAPVNSGFFVPSMGSRN